MTKRAEKWPIIGGGNLDNKSGGGLDIVTDKKKTKTFNKRKNRALLTLRRSQKHYEIFSKYVLRKNITRKQFKRWLGLVSISQTTLGYLVMRTQSKY